MAKTHTIEITAIAFPADTPVAKGDTVVWTNRMGMNHTVTADNGEFDSGALGKDKSFSHLFGAVGTVPYHCDFHDMQGTVTVTEEQMAQTHEIDMVKETFQPGSKSIAKGDTVVWKNRDSMSHTVAADDGKFDSGQIGPGKTFSHTFDAAGTVPYHCDNHEDMKGTITVEEATQAQTHKIEITTKAFPEDTKVAKGDTVVWTNRMSMNHTVTADNGEFDSGPFGKDKSFSQKFDTAGTFGYHCDIHTEMQGQVSVS